MELLIPMILRHIEGIGNIKIRNIIENNYLPKSIDEVQDWLEVVLLKESINSKIISNDMFKYILEKVNKIKDDAIQNNAYMISILNNKYPRLLKEINNAPTILFYKGNYECLMNENIVAIVGTRNPTENGTRVSYKTSEYFANLGYSIVSGLAVGCDTYAHKAAIDYKKSTIAVMPCGLDSIVPKVNNNLANNILESGGCLVSEYECGSTVSKYNYVNRNRIQSGLSKAIIVIETSEKGGTIETVNFGMKQNKIIACYDCDKDYEEIRGNKKFIKQGKAFSYKTLNDLITIEEKMKENYNIAGKQINFNI
ncbi:DNA-processing protein DprA [uncultured Clostridium sp.]|jgi:DNA protecting protein dprA|uniref:DNA-processing protein DprA n=1 Tax=uncultured Clostridium sp. TaxID=59620 RepID=UPI0025F84A2D|nr:DNA-processing protein DprA [uncultured Clostridium sp.]